MTLPCLLAAAQDPAPAKKPTEPLKVAPRAYFAAHCQRCHGIDGSNYVPGFAKEKPLETLKADIARMADGPGGATLKPEDLEVQVAYHQLISSEKPFVSWTSREGLTLKGEVSDGAKVVASVGEKPVEIKVDEDFGWTLVLVSEAELAKLKITATMGKATTVFVPSESAFAKLPKEKKSDPSR